MKHKHADLIHAWADGAKIQCKQIDGSWFDGDDMAPSWNEDYQYRIKPEPKPDWYKYVRIETAGGHMASWQSCSPSDANLRLGFSGETGKLKSAEVL